jgi:hypothetical protein
VVPLVPILRCAEENPRTSLLSGAAAATASHPVLKVLLGTLRVDGRSLVKLL